MPGLVEAGLLWIKQTTRGDHGVQYGLYRLTSEGRRWLNDEAGK